MAGTISARLSSNSNVSFDSASDIVLLFIECIYLKILFDCFDCFNLFKFFSNLPPTVFLTALKISARYSLDRTYCVSNFQFFFQLFISFVQTGKHSVCSIVLLWLKRMNCNIYLKCKWFRTGSARTTRHSFIHQKSTLKKWEEDKDHWTHVRQTKHAQKLFFCNLASTREIYEKIYIKFEARKLTFIWRKSIENVCSFVQKLIFKWIHLNIFFHNKYYLNIDSLHEKIKREAKNSTEPNGTTVTDWMSATI